MAECLNPFKLASNRGAMHTRMTIPFNTLGSTPRHLFFWPHISTPRDLIPLLNLIHM